jgi:hypothetical protein
MDSDIWRIQARAPFAVGGQHHDETGPDGNPAIYEFPKDIAAQVIAAGRAVRVADPAPAA